jgi:hypothetical protein
MKPTIILVGADKGGVGKTFVSRVLLDLMKSRGIPVRAFDAQSPGGELVRFYADAAVVDLESIDGQMRVFDGVDDKNVTVVDLPADQLQTTIQTLDNARLLEEVRSGSMKMVLLHVLGPTIRSISEIGAAAEKIGGVKHLLVKNHVSADAGFFDWDTSDTAEILAQMAPVMADFPNLEGRIREAIEKAGPEKNGESFLDFIADVAVSRTLRNLLKTWLEKCWAELDRVGVLEKAAAQPQASWGG